MSYAILALWSLVCIFPVYWLVNVSIMPTSAVDTGPHILPIFGFSPDLRAWRVILADPSDSLLGPLLNSTVVATATLLTLACSALALYALTRLHLPILRLPIGRGGDLSVRCSAFCRPCLPPRGPARGSPALPIYVMAARQHVGHALHPHHDLCGCQPSRQHVAAARARTQRPANQEESAQLDGASHLRILVSVLLPMVAGGVAATGLLIFMALCWNRYLFAAYLATDHAATLPMERGPALDEGSPGRQRRRVGQSLGGDNSHGPALAGLRRCCNASWGSPSAGFEAPLAR
ncbi:MAG: ABC transporter permease subunit [Hyphomicrobiales bacterium]